MSNNFRKYPKTKAKKFKDFQVLLYKFKDIPDLEFLFSNSRTFKDFQVLYEPVIRANNLVVKTCDDLSWPQGKMITQRIREKIQ